MGAIKTLVIESDPVRREGLQSILAREPDLQVVAAGSDLLGSLATCSPPSVVDVVVIDVDHVDTMKLRTWALLRVALPDSPIVALSDGDTDHILEATLALGVRGLCRLATASVSLSQVIRIVAGGGRDFEPLLADKIKTALMYPLVADDMVAEPIKIHSLTDTVHGKRIYADLTIRQRQVLRLLSEGKSNRQIAHSLGIRPKTVEFHVSNTLRKLGVGSRVEAAVTWNQSLRQFEAPR